MDTSRALLFFDVVSPFAYLALKQVGNLPEGVSVEFVPVLFAGLLNHHGQKGPAEIGPKRRFTYRFALWRARQLGIEMRLPPTHPFNPLSALRLIIALGSRRAVVQRVFDCVYVEGKDVSNPEVIAGLATELGLSDCVSAIAAPPVKQQLHDNTNFAIKHGVFGVPTLLIGTETFWGHDALEMAADFCRNPQLFDAPEMIAADAIQLGSMRRPG